MTLPVTVDFHDGETPLSLASRLAAANGYTSLAAFLGYTEINAKMISVGEPAAMAILSGWSGIAEERLRRFAVSSGETRATWTLGSAEFSKDMRPGNRHRFCAHCILDDLDQGDGRRIARPWVRSSWLPRSIMSCQRHGIALSEVDAEDVGDRNDFALFVADNIDRVRDLAALPESSKSPRLDAYLRQRITGDVGDSFADGLAAYVVVELSAYAGWFIEKHEVRGAWDPADHVGETREKGFMALSAGKDALVDLYVGAINREHPTMRDIELFLGRVILWMRRNADKPSHSDVIDLFVDMVVRHVPIGPGEKFIRDVKVRHLHSVNSASAEYKLLPKRVRDLVIAAGLAEASDLSDAQFRFDAELARPVLEEALETLTSSEVAEVLGTSIDHARGIMDSGLLPRVENYTSTRVYSRVRKRDLDEFQTKLLARANASPDVPSELKALSEVCCLYKVSLEDLVRLILEGKVRSVSISGNVDILSGLRLDPHEVGKILRDQKRLELAGESENVLSLREAERVLGTTTLTVQVLLERGLLRFVTRRNARNNRQHRTIERAEVEAFLKTYCSLSSLAKAWKTSGVQAKSDLDAHGIFPVFEPEGYVARFYEKAKIEAAGLPV